MAFEIEKGIPLPKAASASREGDVYGWERMEVGDSIFIGPDNKVEGDDDLKFRRRIYNAARKFGAKRGWVFHAEVVTELRPNPKYDPNAPSDDSGEDYSKVEMTGVRVWRMADKVVEMSTEVAEPQPSGE